MKRMPLLLLLSAALALPAFAEPLTVAVASNFRAVAEEIAEQFWETTGQEVRFSSGSTGKLYAQILHGAPFDVFLAADDRHPGLLSEADPDVAATRMTYAVGALVLWSVDPQLKGGDCRAALEAPGDYRLAIANPSTAPYGTAAREVLVRLGLWESLRGKLVYGESIAQALQFVATGNARLGMIARSQAEDPRLPEAACRWDVPSGLHEPILQQAVVLQRGLQNPAAMQFLRYLGSPEAAATIRRYGYETAQ